MHGVSKRCDSTWNDRDLLHGIDPGQGHCHQRMPHFMMRHHVAFMRIEDAAALFQACDNSLDRLREILQCNVVTNAAGCQKGSLVHQIGQVRAGEAGGQRRDRIDRNQRREQDFLQVNLKYCHAPNFVRAIDQNLSIEPTGAQQGRIEDLRPVRRGEQDDAAGWIEPVHFTQKLVQGLFFFVMAAATWQHRAPRPPQRI